MIVLVLFLLGLREILSFEPDHCERFGVVKASDSFVVMIDYYLVVYGLDAVERFRLAVFVALSFLASQFVSC
jgi:hypothetical protein